jgi:perosamine synthetase
MMPYAIAPAETRLPFSALVKGFLPGRADFAETLARRLGVDNCFLADSARSLLFLVLITIHKSAPAEQNEVLIPGYTCYSVPAAIVKAGLKVSLYDLDPYSFQPDMADVEKKISPKTLAVVGQHLLGVPSDIAGLTTLARKNHVWCIEDAAQRMEFKKINGQKNELEPDVTLYSFGRGKPLPLGHGGALIAGQDADVTGLNTEITRIASQIDRKTLTPMAVRVLSWPGFYWFLEQLPLGLGQTVYDPDFDVQGMNPAYQRIGFTAADHLDRLNSHRTTITRIYDTAFGVARDSFDTAPPCLRYPILTDHPKRAANLAHLGVRRLYPQALCDLASLKPDLADLGVQTPGARQISQRLVTLPTHLGVSQNTARKISDTAASLFGDISSQNKTNRI